MKPFEAAKRIHDLTAAHNDFRAHTLNMIASENVSSMSLREIVGSDLMCRYSEYENHDSKKRWDEGSRFIIEIEEIVQSLIRRLFGAAYVDLRPISGQIAVVSALRAFAKRGSTVLETDSKNGGHEWYCYGNVPVVHYNSQFFPFDTKEWNIDVDGAAKLIREVSPSVLILGSSYYLFPNPTQELRAVADEVGATVISDDAHVLGLIAGNQWANPLSQGAHVVVGSTHKTFPGPQKGIVITNELNKSQKVANALYPSLVTNHHLMNVAALGVAAAEMLEYGEAYATQIVRNAKALAESLAEQGFSLIAEHKGFTQSHQALMKTEGFMPGAMAAKLLESANIIVTRMELKDANGVRIGTSELTRMGMVESDMKEVAQFYRQVLIDRKDPYQVAGRVKEFTSRFRSIRFSFDSS